MKKLWLIVLPFLLMTVSSLAQNQHAQTEDSPWLSGNAFLRLCSVADKRPDNVEGLNLAACLGYVSGLVDGVVLK